MARLLVALALAFAVLAAIGVSPAVAAWPGQAYPVQSLGDRGTDVVTIQLLLKQRGYAVPASGIFDTATAIAVHTYQEAAGLPADGVVDAAVWQRLIVRLGQGDRGYAARALQWQLHEKRTSSLTIDGVFGSATRAALLAFQRHAGIAASAVAGPVTWQALVWHFELPRFTATGLCDYSVGNGPANWGTSSTIAAVEAAAWTVVGRYGRVAVGDVSFEHGGRLPGHDFHRVGLEVDLRLMRKADDQCRFPSDWRSSTYDRTATRALIDAIRAAAPGHVKLIFFNDPVLIAEGRTSRYPGHDDHLHVRFCEASHPSTAYRC
jgi:hypothetical protein